MDALEFIRERNRMCKSFGDGKGCMSCPFYKEGNRCMAILWKEEIIPIVEKWSKENPRKTRLDVFLEQHPEEKLNVREVLDLCPITSATYEYGSGYCKNPDKSCGLCRREFWLEKVE